MNSPLPAPPGDEPVSGRRTGQIFTMGVALFVLLLALGSVFWPAGQRVSQQGTVLVFDPTGDQERVDNLYRPLTDYLEEISGRLMDLQVVRHRSGFLAVARRGVDILLCPDGLALQVGPEAYEALVVGRRAAPRNLRPRSVQIYRKSAGLVDQPWRDVPLRTVIGDSLSLVSVGAVLTGDESKVPACSWGPDPYDHGPVLHAARLGAFDYAIVRQWDAERFFASGLLSRTEWGLETLGDPMPDIVLLVSKEIPGGVRLETRGALTGFARSDEPVTAAGESLAKGLPLLRLVGFNILLEPDFARLRGIFAGHWQAVAD